MPWRSRETKEQEKKLLLFAEEVKGREKKRTTARSDRTGEEAVGRRKEAYKIHPHDNSVFHSSLARSLQTIKKYSTAPNN
jgi:hypothetical protein